MHEGGPEARARLVIADDHEGMRVLLRTLLGLHPEIEVVGEAENGEEAARLAVSREADIALLDIEMPRMDGLTAAEKELLVGRITSSAVAALRCVAVWMSGLAMTSDQP